MATVTRRQSVRWSVGALGAVVLAAGAWWWHDDRATRFLPAETSAFVARFAPPPARDSATTHKELEEILQIQNQRTPADVAAAQADRRTEVSRFYDALGLDSQRTPRLPRMARLAERVEDDVRIYVRAVKDHFRRLRPYEIDTRIQPCIDNVQGDLSYPSGHAAFAWAMAEMLTDLAPERREQLEQRAEEFARQRMVCGVHFPSDLAAGRQAAQWLLDEMRRSPEYLRESAAAAAELRPLLRPGQSPTGAPTS